MGQGRQLAYLKLSIEECRVDAPGLLCARMHLSLQLFSDLELFSVPLQAGLCSLHPVKQLAYHGDGLDGLEMFFSEDRSPKLLR